MRITDPVPGSKLTIQQENVAQLLGQGHRVPDVAKKFGLSKKTVYGWLGNNPDFGERVLEIGTDSVRAGVAWASERYQSYLDSVEAIAMDESRSARDRLSAFEMLLKRAEKVREDQLQQQLHVLQKAVFGESAIDIIAREVKEVSEEDERIEDPAEQDCEATPEKPSNQKG